MIQKNKIYYNSHLIKTWILLQTILCLLISTEVVGQSDVTYKKLSNLLSLIKNHKSSWSYYNINDEKPLQEEILKLNWNLNQSETFEQLYNEVKDLAIDYQYFLLLSKICSDTYRSPNWGLHDSQFIIDYYYKSLFLKLSIETLTPQLYSNTRKIDTMKYEYTKQYTLATQYDKSFPDFNSFREFAELNIIYAKSILNRISFNLPKKDRSELYWIIADAIYRIKYIADEDTQSLSEVFRHLTLAIKEDNKNWRPFYDRAYYNKTHTKNYNSAIKDYFLCLKIIEDENKKIIAGWNKTSNKQFVRTKKTFEIIADIIECYISLDDYKNGLIWCQKAINSIKEYREYNTNTDELTSIYDGIISYYKALCYYYGLKDVRSACEYIDAALNFGFDAKACEEFKSEINCSTNSLNNNINSIPMLKKGGVYEIPVTINGVLKLNFIFDAGASDVSISPDVALTLIKTGTVKDEDFIGTESYRLADGAIAKSKVFILKEIQLGNKKVYNVKASISSSVKSPLLLGQSVLNKFGKVTINYNKGVIVFED